MDLNDLRTAFSDYRPGHTDPVDLRVVMGHHTGSAFTPPSNLLRIHGTGLQTLAAVTAFYRDGFVDLELIDVDLCSEACLCTHSYWRAPTTLMPDAVSAALMSLPGLDGDDTVPTIEPIHRTEE